jgi:NCS1 family nucleobase:cation symporter-1
VVATGGAILAPSWLKLFQAAWFIGFLGGGLVYYLVCLVSPPPGGKPYDRVPFDNDMGSVIEGHSDSTASNAEDIEKESAATSFKAVKA